MEKAVSGHGVFIYDAAATIARYGSAAMVATALKECDMQHAWAVRLVLLVQSSPTLRYNTGCNARQQPTRTRNRDRYSGKCKMAGGSEEA